MPENTLLVAVIMGSESDWETMQHTHKTLDEFGVAHECRVLSAHRTPERVDAFVSSAYDRGIRVLIAGAGKSAHLAGVVASKTCLPVVGVPLETADLGGLDSLLSTVQMPPGIPVATTAIGKSGARNAGLLAAAILAVNDPALYQNLLASRQRMAARIAETDEALQQEQWVINQ